MVYINFLRLFFVGFFIVLFMRIFEYDKNLLFLSFLILIFFIYLTDHNISIAFLILAGFIITIGEILIINITSNTWSYKDPDIFGIPFWIFLIWILIIYIVLLMYKIAIEFMPDRSIYFDDNL